MNISFTGHRDFDAERFMELLRSHIVRFSQCGSVTFWSGMAVGFDLAAAECVLELRDEGYDLKLCCVVPYVGQSQFFNRVDLERYDLVLRRADRVVTLAADYTPDIFYRRNDYLVEVADHIIAYYDGQARGGTAYTIKQAHKKRVAVDNIYPQQQLSLF